MFDVIENLKIVSIRQRDNKSYVKIENRPVHTFFIRVRGSVLYDFGSEKIIAKEGEVMFVPKGATYESRILCDGARYTSISFDADFAEPVYPTCYSLERFCDADYIASNISDMYNFGIPADRYRCISLIYSLFAYLCTEESSCRDGEKSSIIAPAVEYLKKHIYDCTLRVERLHRMCGISNTYFRQIFVSRFGKTPQSYILFKRLSHARSIIASGDFDTITEVALSVGFVDPLYFSKAYKKAYGEAPTEACRRSSLPTQAASRRT